MERIKLLAARACLRAADGALGVARFALFPVRPRRRVVRKVCVHRVGHIGDILCALPALSMIREHYREARITLLTTPVKRGMPGAADLLGGSNLVDSLDVYYAEELRSLPALWRFILHLRRQRYDVWIELPQILSSFSIELRNLLAAKLAGVRWAGGHRVGMSRLFPRIRARAGKFRREAELQKGYMRSLGILDDGFDPRLEVPEREMDAARRLLENNELAGSLVLGMAPGAKRPANRWPPERFAEIGRRWVAAGGRVAILGGGDDSGLGAKIAGAIGAGAVSFCGAATLLQSAGILMFCRALVTNDTGTMHLGAAVGTPCVVPFSARDYPYIWYPTGAGHAVLRKDPPCSPCFLDECPLDNLCLRRIEVEEVWRMLAGHLES